MDERFRIRMENNQERKRATNDEEEERKQAARRVPLAELNQTHSDFVIAMALQEQENNSEEDEAESEDSDQENGNDYEFFESQELEYLEAEDSNSEEEDDMEEDDIDPDELSYEELLELGEFIGEAKRGLSMNEIPKCLNSMKYKRKENKSGIDRCVICQVEYEEGDEDLVALSCDHPYHSQCIINWLQIKKVCPICTSEVSSSKIV
ncbi:E3 ubiquitin ligase BIG BROTHER-related-like [Euphorbia lathyris]|uniref:E3 ubiquitin ligase BIG BROTHER-related-like n=1 Tax=Euphorbia lathyris TaxID=212925 RepID=UPI003313EC5A